jgi:hypothetical protein
MKTVSVTAADDQLDRHMERGFGHEDERGDVAARNIVNFHHV